MAIKSEGINVNNENTEIYFIFVCDPVLFLLPAEYKRTTFLNISEKKIINKNTSIIRRTCKFLSLKDKNPWFIKVRKVTIPRVMQRIEEIIIQFRPLIILNILNNS